ncbi:MAG TPA: choline kinase family protein [Gaiellaceae bacterium]|nr:choline kinase family protein [Gaiellaceae bacterium]
MRVEEMVERVWPGVDAEVEPLGGGATNHNVKVRVGGETFVLRSGGRDTAALGIDRRAEHEATLSAAAVGVGPEVVRFLEPEGILVTRWIEGAIVERERLREPDGIRRVAQALRAVHAGPPIPSRFDAFRAVEAYRAAAATRGVVPPPSYEDAKRVADRIERARGAVPERPCHNDLLHVNIVDDGRRLRLVDWEYAGMGDVFFDLANFATNQELDDDGVRVLLRAYFGEVRREHERALRLMRFMSDFREAMWAVAQRAVSSLRFDYAAHAERHFERLERTARERAFRRALG